MGIFKAPMVLVTVGSTDNDFRRLLTAVDQLMEQGILRNVVAQIGNTDYRPKNYEYFAFAPFDKIRELARDAALIITHAGTGSVNLALSYKKKTIVVPRRVSHGEHPDDHQVELAELLSGQGRVLYAKDPSDLKELLDRYDDWEPIFKPESENIRCLSIIDEEIKRLLGN